MTNPFKHGDRVRVQCTLTVDDDVITAGMLGRVIDTDTYYEAIPAIGLPLLDTYVMLDAGLDMFFNHAELVHAPSGDGDGTGKVNP